MQVIVVHIYVCKNCSNSVIAAAKLVMNACLEYNIESANESDCGVKGPRSALRQK